MSDETLTASSGLLAEREERSTALTRSEPEIRALTSFRGFLAWWVVGFHVTPLTLTLFPSVLPVAPLWGVGDAAVDVFFLMSGFVIRLVYGDRLRSVTGRSYGSFLWARLARLYPVHLSQQLAWLLAVSIALLLHKPGFDASSLDLNGFVANLLLVQAWGVPMQMHLNYPSWSISMEWFAYLCTPLVFALDHTTRKHALRALSALAVWLLLALSTRWPNLNHFFRVGCAYTLGVMLASTFPARVVPPWLAAWRLPLGAALVFAMVALQAHQLSYSWALPIAAVLVLALVAEASRTTVAGSRWAVYLGRSSYSLYMTHAFSVTLMHQLLRPAKFEQASLWVRFGVLFAYVAVIFAIAAATYELIEQPARNYMRKYFRPATPA